MKTFEPADISVGAARRVHGAKASAAAVLLCVGELLARGQSIPVPNGSFESPPPPPGFPATPQVDNWLKAPQPAGVVLPGGITWEQLAGVFPNTPPGSSDRIDNLAGNQAAYMIAIPGVSLFQELGVSYEVGKAYTLTVGILGGGGLFEGSSFLLSAYYRDGANNRVPVGALPVTYSQAAFPSSTHLTDIIASTRLVEAGDAWAGKPIGIELLSTFGVGAGYWDLDNVRLVAIPEPGPVALLGLGLAGVCAARWRARRRG